MADFDLGSSLGDILSLALKQTGVEDVSAPHVENGRSRFPPECSC